MNVLRKINYFIQHIKSPFSFHKALQWLLWHICLKISLPHCKKYYRMMGFEIPFSDDSSMQLFHLATRLNKSTHGLA